MSSSGARKGAFDLHGWLIPYTDEIAREHARIWAEAEAAGKMTGYYDLIVAATARHRGSQLATFNRRHFEHIRGLNLVPL